MSRAGRSRRRAGSAAALLAAGLALAACNSATAARVIVVGLPSTSIEVPLSLTACTTANSCVALGTSSVGSGPSATAEFRRTSGLWVALRTPDTTSPILTSASCWRSGCLIGGTSATGDLFWRYQAAPPSLSAIAGPALGASVSAVSCYAASQCAVVDSTGPVGDSRLVVTTDGGSTWSTPEDLAWSPSYVVTGLACVNTLDCLITATHVDTNLAYTNPVIIEVTRSGGITWQSIPVPSGATALTSLSCNPHHCDALVSTSAGDEWARSRALGRGWSVRRLSGSPTAMACTPSGRCVLVGSTHLGPWLASTRATSLAVDELRYAPSPFTAVACGASRCSLSAPSTVASFVP